jgi:hypothetical protein
MLKFCTEADFTMAKIIKMFAVGMAVLLLCTQCGATNTVQLSEAEIDAKLSALKPLPKVHYFYAAIGGGLSDGQNNRRLYEYARITHALSFWGEWVKQEQLDNFVHTCAQINKTNPEIPASIAVFYNPWHRKFGKDLPPTDRGSTYHEEIRFFSERLNLIKEWLASANKKYDTSVKLSAILLDCERFETKENNESWNEGMREALDAIHIEARTCFPEARIEWYGRGIREAAGGDGWAKTSYWTGKEIKAPLSCSLYTIPEIDQTRETFRRTCKLADQLGVSDVTPWVALAAGYRRGLLKSRYWDTDWSFDIIYSYLIGAELNIKWYGDRPDRFAPYNRAKVIIFYPPPFDKQTPDWAIHFIAYVRGATGVKELKDLGHEE